MHDKNSESLAKFKEALRMQLAELGERHPDIAITMSNLGVASRACGLAEDSASYFGQAVEICQKVIFSIFYKFAEKMANPQIQNEIE